MTQTTSISEKKFLKKEFFTTLMPTSIAMVTHSFYCLVDVFFVGVGVGSDGIAALNIALPIFTVFTCIGLLLGVGATTTMSVLLGEGNQSQNNKIFTMVCIINVVIGVILSIVGYILCEPIAIFFGADEVLLPYVMDYLQPILATAFIYILSCMLQVIIRADRNPKLIMVASIAGNVAM